MMSKLRNSLCELCTALIFLCGCSNEPLQPIRSGEMWPDNNGEHINAHGGGVMYYDGTYYWFGENKCDTTSSAMVGVMCYSSRNLTDWKNEGVALSVVDNDSSDIARGCILERPKVIFFKVQIYIKGYKPFDTLIFYFIFSGAVFYTGLQVHPIPSPSGPI